MRHVPTITGLLAAACVAGDVRKLDVTAAGDGRMFRVTPLSVSQFGNAQLSTGTVITED